MAEPNISREIAYEVTTSPDFQVHSVTGIFGGITPRGEVCVNTFAERLSLPLGGLITVDEYGMAATDQMRMPSPKIVREVNASFLMDRATALAFRDWLNSNIAAMDQLEAQAKVRRE